MPVNKSQSLDVYFGDLEISFRNAITPKEELELLDGWESKDEYERNKIRHELVVKNLKFAASGATKFKGQGLPLEDLVGLANVGMVEAAKRFDPAREFRFITFAVWWVRRNIGDAIKSAGDAVRVPMSVKNNESILKRISSEFYKSNERWPSRDELRVHFGDLTDEALEKALEASLPYFSLDSPVGDESRNERTFLDIQASELPDPERTLIEKDSKKILDLIWGVITEREQEVIRRYYGVGQEESESLSEIGREHGLTRERIRQIHSKALQKIRNKPSLMRTVIEAMQES